MPKPEDFVLSKETLNQVKDKKPAQQKLINKNSEKILKKKAK